MIQINLMIKALSKNSNKIKDAVYKFIEFGG